MSFFGLNNSFYVFGGNEDNDFHRYNVKDKRWSKLLPKGNNELQNRFG